MRLLWMLSVLSVCSLTTVAVAQTNTGNAFNGKTSEAVTICPESKNAFSDNDVINLIDEITRISNLQNRFIVQSCPGIDNCQAVYYDGKPYILYNAAFLSEVKRLSFSDKQLVTTDKNWEALAILAHELAHHFNQHLNNPPPGITARQLELEADEYAGSVLYQIGATLQQAQLAFQTVPDVETYTHPARKDRLAAVERGWQNAKKRFPGSGPQEPVKQAVKFISNAAGTLYIDGRRMGELRTDQPVTLLISKGESLLRLVSTENEKDVAEGSVSIKNITDAFFYRFDLQRIKEERLNLAQRTLNEGNTALDNRNYSLAFSSFKTAADLGNIAALNQVGWCYQNGYGTPQNYQSALQWYTRAAEKGHGMAMNNIGWLYHDGEGGIAKNIQKAVEWFTKAAELNISNAHYALGHIAETGENGAKNYKDAFYWYNRAAESNHNLAIRGLGSLYAYGLGVPKNEDKAFSYFEKAASNGNIHSMLVVADCYRNGKLGRKRDRDLAEQWYKKACDAGNKDACGKDKPLLISY